jgi:hypothetical protein
MHTVRLGDLVTTTENTCGVVTDIDPSANALVCLTDGPNLTEFDRSHGRWYSPKEITAVTGHDASTLVWRGPRLTEAGD